MALHPTYAVADPSAIHVGPLKKAEKPTVQTADKKLEITWNDEVSEQKLEKSKKFSFFDFLDIVNPLQHIPIISSIYRHFTGDNIHPVSRVAGGALFGGPIGAAVSGVDAIVAQETGQYMGDKLFARIIDNDKSSQPATATPEIVVAKAETTETLEVDPFDDEFLFEDFSTEEEEAERLRRLALAREHYLKSMGQSAPTGSFISQSY